MATLLAKISNLAGVGKSFFNFSGTKIGELAIDATYSSNIKLSNTITDHPIDRSNNSFVGSYVSDHIYNNSLTVDLQCAIHDSPIGILATASSIIDIFSGNIADNLINKYKGKGKNQIAAYDILSDMANQGTIFTLVVYLDTIENLVIESIDFPRDMESGNRLLFNIKLKQLKFATSTTIGVNSVRGSISDLVSSKVNLGGQVTKDLNTTQVSNYSSQLFKYLN